ncbi:MAG: helix-turn-helix transcriptional regulator [Microbacterium sp.]
MARRKSQEWLAAEIGESAFYISRRLRNEINFDTDDLDKIAAAFGIKIDEIFAAAAAVRAPDALDSREAVHS